MTTMGRKPDISRSLPGEGHAAACAPEDQARLTKNRITGKIVGGTGRYAAATGSYDVSWHYVLEAEDGSIQGRVTGLKGLVRRDPLAGASDR